MNINSIKGFERCGKFVLNKNPSKTLLKFEMINPNDNRKGSHTYVLCVNNDIKKMGCSVTSLKNFAGYGVGNGGQPSDRTTGIHYYIARELYHGNNVDFYIQMCPLIAKVDTINLFGEPDTLYDTYLDPKEIENFHLESYKKRFKHLPEWNKQEAGRKNDWEEEIKKIALNHKSKTIIPFDPETTSTLMRLYNWKYHNQNIF